MKSKIHLSENHLLILVVLSMFLMQAHNSLWNPNRYNPLELNTDTDHTIFSSTQNQIYLTCSVFCSFELTQCMWEQIRQIVNCILLQRVVNSIYFIQENNVVLSIKKLEHKLYIDSLQGEQMYILTVYTVMFRVAVFEELNRKHKYLKIH